MLKKNILVTGGGGFLGAVLAQQLASKGFKVTVLDKKIKKKFKNIKYIKGSIENSIIVNRSLRNIDYVYHFASMAGIEECNKNAEKAIRTNVLGTINVLNSSIRNNIKKIIFASSIYVLSEQGGVYKSTKQCCENLIENYNKLYGLNFVSLRFGSLYGPDSNDFNFISNAIKQAIRENKIERNGDGSEVRKYIYVEDAARAAIKVLKNNYQNKYYEITGEKAITIKSLLQKIKNKINTHTKIKYNLLHKDADHYYKNPNTFKIRKSKILKFKNVVNIDKGLEFTIKQIYDSRSK
jgi:UDP-glucose 4-epimerase